MSICADPDEDTFVDQIVQTAYSDLSTPDALFGSESDISEQGPWTDDDGDEDQWDDYDSDNLVDRVTDEKEQGIAFQKRLQAIKNKAQPFTEERRKIRGWRIESSRFWSNTDSPFRSNPH